MLGVSGALAPTLALALLAPGLQLTPLEQEYLRGKPVLRVCADPEYYPFDFVDRRGEHRGIAGDLLAKLAGMLGVSLELVPSGSWAETLALARRGECDLVSMLNETPSRAEYLSFSRPYLTFGNVILTNRPAYHRGLGSLAGRSVALPEGFRLNDLIAADHPEIEVVPVAHTEAALEAVARGEVYATIMNQQRMIGEIQRLRIRNLHFAGDAEVSDLYRIGVRKGDDLLLGILDKALGRVPPEEIDRIMERWYVVQVEPRIDWRLVLLVAGVAVIAVSFLVLHAYHKRRYYALVEQKNQELEHLSATDVLTRAANRRRLEQQLAAEIARSRRHGRPFSVILFDIDQFKEINDRRGHHLGDQVLVEIAELTRRQQRDGDLFGRWGGDEFLVLCTESHGEKALIMAQRLQSAVGAHAFPEGVEVTLSLGVAELGPLDTEQTLLVRADEALYRAKGRGRDRVELAPAISTASRR